MWEKNKFNGNLLVMSGYDLFSINIRLPSVFQKQKVV